MKKYFALRGLALLLLLLPSCASTKVVESWRDMNDAGGPAEELFVIAVVKNRGPRSLIEEAIVKELKSRGVAARASTALFPEEMLPGRDLAVAKAKELGIGSALVVRFVKKDSGGTHTPGRVYAKQPDFDETWQDTRAAEPDALTPEVSYEYTVATMKTLLYRTGSQQPVWGAVTETKYQDHPLTQARPFAAAVVRSLARDGMIK